MIAKISVIIPVYNAEAYIKRALDSVITQTIQDFEIIIIDDSSTDHTIPIIEGYNDKRIKIYKIEHSGVSRARNIGVDKSETDFIAFLDADDEWIPFYIETMLNLKEKYPNAGIYIGKNIYSKDYHEQEFELKKDDDTLINNFFSYYLVNTSSVSTSGVALYKKIFKEMNGFDEKAAWGEDGDLWFRIALHYPVVNTDNVGTISHVTGSWENKISKRIAITKEHPFIKNGKDALSKKEVSEYLINDLIKTISSLQINSAHNNIVVGDFNSANLILNNIDKRYYKWQKLYLKFWVGISNITNSKIGKFLFNLHLAILMKISSILNHIFHIKIINPF